MAAPDKTTFGIVFVFATVGFVFFSLKLSHYTTLGNFLLPAQLWLNPSLAGVNFFIARNCEVLFYLGKLVNSTRNLRNTNHHFFAGDHQLDSVTISSTLLAVFNRSKVGFHSYYALKLRLCPWGSPNLICSRCSLFTSHLGSSLSLRVTSLLSKQAFVIRRRTLVVASYSSAFIPSKTTLAHPSYNNTSLDVDAAYSFV